VAQLHDRYDDDDDDDGGGGGGGGVGGGGGGGGCSVFSLKMAIYSRNM